MRGTSRSKRGKECSAIEGWIGNKYMEQWKEYYPLPMQGGLGKRCPQLASNVQMFRVILK